MTSGNEIIDHVWAGHPVGFDAIADDTNLYVGYYNARRELTIACRPIGGGDWQRRSFRSKIGWDSHKYVVLAKDGEGRIHIAANMHVSPLNYFMMNVPGDIDSIEKVDVLVSHDLEKAVTYPEFVNTKDGRLIFNFRDGTCGDGSTVYYSFDHSTSTWKKLTSTPLLDGEGDRNAYPVGPVLNEQGWFHLVWVWRETIGAESNHSLCHAKSRDLIEWRGADGKILSLPITTSNSPVVDPVSEGGGMINNNTVLGFDRYNRVMVSYHKYDANGQTQIYLARFENSKWKISQASEWTEYRWEFGGPGSLEFEITIGTPYQRGSQIVVPVTRLGEQIDLLLNAKSLNRVSDAVKPTSWNREILSSVDCPDGMQTNSTAVGIRGKNFLFVWNTLPTNRDLPRPGHPEPSELRLFESSIA